MSTRAHFVTAADALCSWRDDILMGKAPVLYPIGSGELATIEVGPQLVTLIGGAPGAGKTAFSMQVVADALRLTPTLRVLVCNVEMSAGVLLDRQLARLSGVDLTTIRYRKLGAQHADRIDQALNTMTAFAERLCFVRPPFDLGNVAATLDEFDANVILLDYIQRITPPGHHDNRRNSVDATMNFLRKFADAGMAVIVVSAVGRSKDSKGRNTYAGDGLNLASFRESSELEFGADDAFILAPAPKRGDDVVVLRHLKSRHGEAKDLFLDFDKPHQRFTSAADQDEVNDDTRKVNPTDSRKIRSALASLWSRTTPAPDHEDGNA